jgi:hypothetical protein
LLYLLLLLLLHLLLWLQHVRVDKLCLLQP